MKVRQLIEDEVDDKDELLVGDKLEHVYCGQRCEVCGEACTLMHRPGDLSDTAHLSGLRWGPEFNDMLDRP